MSISSKSENPHLVFLPSGIGHSTPFLRLAVAMASHNFKVTFINVQEQEIKPNFANEKGVEILDFYIQTDASAEATIGDPFISHVAAINHSLHQLDPILNSLKASAIFSDFAVAATLARISDNLNVPLYLVSATSAKFFAVVADIPRLLSRDPEVFSNSSEEIEVEGMKSILKSSIPSAWLHNYSTNHLLKEYLLPNARAISRLKGVFLNSFDWFEQEILSKSTNSRLPPLFQVGPLPNYAQQKGDHHHHHLPWLSEQPAQKVVYVNFGSRELMPPQQIKELERGLEISGYSYLWVTHGHGNSGESCLERCGKGMILRGGVDQERVLADPAIGVFVNQCEWRPVMEAAWEGVPILGWPQHGDQKMNAEAVVKSGLGIWMKGWGGEGEEEEEEGVDGAHRIGGVLRQMMEDLEIKKGAKIVRERARAACENGGTSLMALNKFLHMFTSKQELAMEAYQ